MFKFRDQLFIIIMILISEIPQMFPTETIKLKKKKIIRIEEFSWICIKYHYSLWEYRKELDWDPNFKIV